MTKDETIPAHIYDYIREHWRSIPHDVTSLQKLIILNNWIDSVTVEQLQETINRLRNE